MGQNPAALSQLAVSPDGIENAFLKVAVDPKTGWITRLYDKRGSANRRPAGLSVSKIDYTPPTSAQAGQVIAHLQLAPGASYSGDQHLGSIVLIDEATLTPVYFDYHTNLSSEVDAAGNLAVITLTIPPGTKMPPSTKVIVVADVFPLHEEVLRER